MPLYDGPYDFNEQRQYSMGLVALKTGDKVSVECTYENPNDRSVGFGESSLDEMCFIGLYRLSCRGRRPGSARAWAKRLSQLRPNTKAACSPMRSEPIRFAAISPRPVSLLRGGLASTASPDRAPTRRRCPRARPPRV